MSKTIGILTGGGDCPGLNAVIRASVKVGIEKYGWKMIGIEDAFSGLVDLNYHGPRGNRELSVEDVRGIFHRGGTILGTSNRSNPFEFVQKNSDGTQTLIDISSRVIDNANTLGLDAVISVGGDGSMRIAKQFLDMGLNIVGVPKTIDNDLGATDQTFGFDTAVQTATEAIDRLRDTAESHDRVMIVEVMGRDAGWIALHAGVAGGADAILIPEIPYRIQSVAEMLNKRFKHGKSFAIIVVAEGAKPVEGEASVGAKALGEMPRLMGAANRVAQDLAALTDADMRVTVLGHVQRGGSPSAFDRVLGTRFGHAAAELIHENKFGRMVALKSGSITSVTLEEATASQKLVPQEHQLIESAKAIGVTFGE